MSTTNIREWLRAEGHDVPSRGPLPAALRTLYNDAHPVSDPSPDMDPPAAQEVSAPDTRPVQPSPNAAKPSAVQRAKSKWRQKSPAADRPAGRGRRRFTTEGIFAGAWSLGARLVGVNEQLIPMAKVMSLQAPVAGVIIDDAVKGTALDRLVQPFARMSEKGTEISALLGPPLLVAMIAQRPELYSVLYQPLYSSLVAWVKLAAPALKRKRAEMEKLASEMTELGAELGVEEGGDFIHAWIEGFFAAVPAGQATADAA